MVTREEIEKAEALCRAAQVALSSLIQRIEIEGCEGGVSEWISASTHDSSPAPPGSAPESGQIR